MAEFICASNSKEYLPRLPTRDCDFKALFRFEEENFQWLADRFLGQNEETRGGALTSLHKMKICLVSW